MKNIYIQDNEQKFNETMEFLKKELSMLRCGRAHPSMVENIFVDSYGVKSPLKHVTSITMPDPKTIRIQPWDKTIIKNIEKAILEANIGINPVNEGNAIRLSIPPMTSEDRVNLVKKLNEKLEQARVRQRHIRDEIRENIISAKNNKEITEDDKFDYLKELDNYVKDQNDVIKKIGDDKERELITL